MCISRVSYQTRARKRHTKNMQASAQLHANAVQAVHASGGSLNAIQRPTFAPPRPNLRGVPVGPVVPCVIRRDSDCGSHSSDAALRRGRRGPGPEGTWIPAPARCQAARGRAGPGRNLLLYSEAHGIDKL